MQTRIAKGPDGAPIRPLTFLLFCRRAAILLYESQAANLHPSHFTAAFQCSSQGDFVCVFQIAAHRDAIRQTSYAHP